MENTNRLNNNDPLVKILKRILATYKIGGSLLVMLAFLILFSNSTPNLWYRVNADAVNNDADTLAGAVSIAPTLSKVTEIPLDSNGQAAISEFATAKELPSKNPDLPEGLHIVIPKIGVQTKVHQGSDAYAELDKGVWMPPEFRGPHETEAPMIMAAHRFGYISWSNEFRRTNSFYNLPKLEDGDEIIIISDQREFRYKVVAKYEAEKTIRLNHDLTLYTCKFFDNDTRIVVGAERIN
ncbi:MAG: sortase [Candidatus Dojkabacteria bacterium]